MSLDLLYWTSNCKGYHNDVTFSFWSGNLHKVCLFSRRIPSECQNKSSDVVMKLVKWLFEDWFNQHLEPWIVGDTKPTWFRTFTIYTMWSYVKWWTRCVISNGQVMDQMWYFFHRNEVFPNTTCNWWFYEANLLFYSHAGHAWSQPEVGMLHMKMECDEGIIGLLGLISLSLRDTLTACNLCMNSNLWAVLFLKPSLISEFFVSNYLELYLKWTLLKLIME